VTLTNTNQPRLAAQAFRLRGQPIQPTPMKSFSFMWNDRLSIEIGRAAPKRGYPMSLVGEDCQTVIAAVNQGIDAHLEACFVPARGDRFRMQTPEGIRGKISGPRLECNVSPQSLPVLIRRLIESGDEGAESLASSICQTLDIELI
jgi:hypothetical protein